jgi:DNA-binding CsgD family transcriptional regulator
VGSGIFRGDLDNEQRTIFALILDGKTVRDIADVLGAAPARIEATVRKTCRQLDVSSRHEAAQIIANHYGWSSVPPKSLGYANGRRRNRRYGTESGHPTSKTVQTKREHSPHSVYVRDVGKQGFDKAEDTGVYSEVAGRISISKFLAASSAMQRLLLIALLVASCALALSALISAMQGFDILLFSRFRGS